LKKKQEGNLIMNLSVAQNLACCGVDSARDVLCIVGSGVGLLGSFKFCLDCASRAVSSSGMDIAELEEAPVHAEHCHGFYP
jgi:hypothetical protein